MLGLALWPTQIPQELPGQETLLRLIVPQTAALMTFIACSRMSLRAVREALRAAEASSSTSIDPTDSEDRFNNAVARRDLVEQQQNTACHGMA